MGFMGKSSKRFFNWTLVMRRGAISFSLAVFSCQTLALGCLYPDRELYRNSKAEREHCSQAGYCTMYDLNPTNGRYEYYYGYHNACPGVRERTNYEITCQRPDGSLFMTTENGFWGGCQI